MDRKIKIIWFLAIMLIATIAISGYYVYQQRQSINSQNLAQNAQCQLLGSQFYQQEQAEAAQEQTFTINSGEPPYYKYSSKLDACVYIVSELYSQSNPPPLSEGYSGEEDIYDLTHGNIKLAAYGLVSITNPTASAQSYDAADRKEFCTTFTSLFSDDIAKYQAIGAMDVLNNQIAFAAKTICAQQ